MSNVPYTRLDKLENRPVPSIFKAVHINLHRNDTGDKAVKEDIEEIEESKEIEDIEESKDEPIDGVVSDTIIPVKVVDKRRTSTINRTEILLRMKRNRESGTCSTEIDSEINIDILRPTVVNKTGKTIKIVDVQEEPLLLPPPPDAIDDNEDYNEDETVESVENENIEEIELDPVVLLDELNENEVTKDKPKPRKLKVKQQKGVEEEKGEDVDITTAVIRTQKVIDRLPKDKEKIKIKAPSYYMANRKIYVQKLAELFSPYRQDLTNTDNVVSCDNRNVGNNFDLLTHQEIVRDYLNLYTPYRGLLLYHGLGSGKTCTSIAIAEGMKSDKQVIVMTPASLQMNFLSEMKKCGDDLYKKNQFWEFISTDGTPEYVGILSRALSLSREYITSNHGAWLVNVNKAQNYTTLTTREQELLEKQLNAMIKVKYTNLNYNGGIHEKKLAELTENGKKNLFDNKVIIIDEAHNFVSRIVNKIKDPKSISYKLYNYLSSAKNAKIILLTGTPIINYPNEISILYNILRGYITTWKIPISWEKTEKLNSDTILDMFNSANFKTYDYVDYSDNKLIVTRNPFGFINVKKRGKLPGSTKKVISGKTRGGSSTRKSREKCQKGGGETFERYNGVQLDESGNISDDEFLASIKRILRNPKHNVKINDSQIEKVYNKALPDERDMFFNNFIDEDNMRTKNINTFQRRILGLTSYFRSAQEDLLPSIIKTETEDLYHIVKTPMSDHQFSIYEKIRKEEADREKKSKTAKRMQQPSGDDMYNISSTYRVFSRAACNFTFPRGIERPLPNKKIDDVSEDILDMTRPEKESEPDVESGIGEEDSSYATRIESAMELLNQNKENSNISRYLSNDELNVYSSKFAKILENVMNEENIGLHLLYSHFRTMEGIAVLRLIFMANGMAEFKLKRSGDQWLLDIKEEDMAKPKFVLYTGTETTEEKEIIRNVYNGTWEFVPQNIVEKLEEQSPHNIYGDVIKVLMITSSGAEGINLRNTRFVHIVEPYWHMVRVEQVVGRARRICSHQDLPEDMRTVKVFLYITTLSEKQKTDENNIELRIRDISRFDKKTPVTTDESLYEIASAKQKVNNEILQAIKETAIDCNIYSSQKIGKDTDDYVCYGHGMVESNEYSSYPSFEKDITIKDGLDRKETKMNAIKKQIDGINYAMDKKSGKLYDLESFMRAKEKKGDLIYVGQHKEVNGKSTIMK